MSKPKPTLTTAPDESQSEEMHGWKFVPAEGAKYKYDYVRIAADLNAAVDARDTRRVLAIIRDMSLHDLFFLLVFVLGLDFLNNKDQVAWVYEVQKSHNRTLDLWAREFGKTTIISMGLTTWLILNNPESTTGILSYNKALAKNILRQLKITFETNALLKNAFPDIFYKNPDREAPKWSEDDGLIVRRKSIVKEPTIGAYGLTDGMPTGMHFSHLLYDDIVTKDSVGTPEQIEKTIRSFRMSQNCGRRGGMKRVVGTIYDFADCNRMLELSGDWIVRKKPAEDEDGNPVLLTKEELEEKRKDLGEYDYSSQMLLKPIAEENQVFKIEWLKYFTVPPSMMHVYIVADPAGGESREDGDYTVFWVFGVDYDKNYFLLDGIRDRITLGERWRALKHLIEKWEPKIVGYEKFGMQSDIQHFKEKMEEEGFYFTLIELGGKGPKSHKKERIKSLVPLFEDGKIKFPKYMPYKNKKGVNVDLIQQLIGEEYLRFPQAGGHDDMLDCLANIRSPRLEIIFPHNNRPKVFDKKPFDYFNVKSTRSTSSLGQF